MSGRRLHKTDIDFKVIVEERKPYHIAELLQ